MKNEKTKRITLTAMMLALSTVIAFICGLIPFLNFPFGGGFTIGSMLPIVIIAYIYGTKWGLFTGFCYAVIQMLLGYSTVSALFIPGSDSYMLFSHAIIICLLDYIVAYTLIGLGGVFRNRIKSKGLAICLGSIVALSARYIVHIISGFIFYGAYAEWFFGVDEMAAIGPFILSHFSGDMLSLIYSIIYNGCYMIPEIIVTAVLSFLCVRIPYVAVRNDA